MKYWINPASLLAIALSIGCTSSFAESDSWINLDSADLETQLNSTLSAIKNQTSQISTNQTVNAQQDIDIQYNLDLINSLDGQINERITTLTTYIDDEITQMYSDAETAADDINTRFVELDEELDAEFADISAQFESSDEALDDQYAILVALNSQTKSINGVDVIAGTAIASGSLADQLSQLSASLSEGQSILSDHESRLNSGASALGSLQSLVNSKTTLSEVKSSVSVGVNTSTSCVLYRFARYVNDGGGEDSLQYFTSSSRPTSNYYNLSCLDYQTTITGGYLY